MMPCKQKFSPVHLDSIAAWPRSTPLSPINKRRTHGHHTSANTYSHLIFINQINKAIKLIYVDCCGFLICYLFGKLIGLTEADRHNRIFPSSAAPPPTKPSPKIDTPSRVPFAPDGRARCLPTHGAAVGYARQRCDLRQKPGCPIPGRATGCVSGRVPGGS